jgi:hypothetical protein
MPRLRRCAVAPCHGCAVAPLRRCAVAPLRRCAVPDDHAPCVPATFGYNVMSEGRQATKHRRSAGLWTASDITLWRKVAAVHVPLSPLQRQGDAKGEQGFLSQVLDTVGAQPSAAQKAAPI